MRTFIAIEFSEKLKEYLDSLSKKIATYSKTGNFTKKENYHLTLRFIGETDKSDIELLCCAIQETSMRNKGFELPLNKLGEFKRNGKSIVWAGVSDEKKELSRLFASLEKSLEAEGFPREKKGLNPHITLGREVSLIKEPAFFEEYLKDAALIPFKEISLMESVRTGQGLVYRRLFSEVLKK